MMDPLLPVIALSLILGSLLAFVIFHNYFIRKKSEVESISKSEIHGQRKYSTKQLQQISKKNRLKPNYSASNKEHGRVHHPLNLNTLKGHNDSVWDLSFSSNGRSLATACADGVVRVFKLDDASSKSFKFIRINTPGGGYPTAVTLSDNASSLIVASQTILGSSLHMFMEANAKTADRVNQQIKTPVSELKWEHHKAHENKAILSLFSCTASYGTADGSTIVVSCSEGTDIKLVHGETGKILGNLDTNQLKNTMAAISQNGRFVAAAAFTGDVKVWEIVYSKDGSVKEVVKVMQLKGHKSAVTWLCFTPNCEQVITASKDGSIRIWDINVRYNLDEDPKVVRVFPIHLTGPNGDVLHYDRIAISPDVRLLAVTHGPTLQWLCVETGKVLDTAENAHESKITNVAWTPEPVPVGDKTTVVLATASTDRKVKLWLPPLNNE